MTSIPALVVTHVALALLAGALAAHVFCRVLWHEAATLTAGRAPAIRAVGGAALRTLLSAGFLMLVGGGEWVPTVAALAGFSVSRWATTRRIMRMKV